MSKKIIFNIEQEMDPYLNKEQMEQLRNVLQFHLYKIEVSDKCEDKINNTDQCDYVRSFLAAKKVEGCSERTLLYYKTTIDNMLKEKNYEIRQITTDNLRNYLAEYQEKRNCSKVTIDNVRRILSTFFAWLEDEDYIMKSPVRRIRKVKSAKKFKETYTDESIEVMRDSCGDIRDLAMIDLLISTGMRVGELVKLNIDDINFNERECVVFGKGNKQRKVYFDARAKIHIQKYIKSRSDMNPALFVSLQKPNNRLQISGVEIRLRELGKRLNIHKVHPHKFRRTLATRAIDKGMPIEQVQQLLGHQKIDTTLEYAMVDQMNVKNSHRKYIG